MVVLIKCAWCGAKPEGYALKVPNEDVEVCDHCGGYVGSLTRTFSFCSAGCVQKFLEEYIQDSLGSAKN